MAENAISYINNTISNLKMEKSDVGVLSHDRFKLDDTVYSLYDPQNIIIDHKARDLAEYIKISFVSQTVLTNILIVLITITLSYFYLYSLYNPKSPSVQSSFPKMR